MTVTKRKPAASKGREQRRKSATARARTPSLDRFYRYALPAISPGEFTFELMLLRPRRADFRLDTMCQSFTWDESSSEMTGNLQLRRPGGEAAALPVARGQRVRCRVRWQGSWYELWTMRVQPPEVNVEQGLVSVNLVDDMDLLKRTRRDWSYRPTKRRKFGYFPQEIVRLVCRRAGIKVGAVAAGRFRVPAISLKNASPLDVFKAAYKHERDKTGRSFVIRLRDGRLEIVALKRNPVVYVLASEIQTALLGEEAASETPATVWTGRGRIGKGKAARKVGYTDYDRAVVRRFGYVHHTHDYGKVVSRADLRVKVERDLAKALKTTNTAQVTHAGIPFIRRGDGAMLELRGEGYSGKQAFVYATTAAHSVQGATYTSTWDFTSDDPFLTLQAEAEKAQREAKRKQRKRTKTKAAGKG